MPNNESSPVKQSVRSKVNPANEKLQKVVARAGLASRREAERWIEEGKISINGKLAHLGDRVGPLDKIRVNGVLLTEKEQHKPDIKVLMYHKPEGEVCTRKDPEGRKTVFDSLPRIQGGRWIHVGRLDTNTSGLLLFTNDGELANRLMHPSSEIQREYAVRIRGEVTDDMLNRLRKGVELDDGMASFQRIRDAGGEGTNHWYHVTLLEGKNREVRRLWESQDVQVSRLIRVSYGVCELDRSLPRGRWRSLTEQEVKDLLKSVHLKGDIAEDKKGYGKRKLRARTNTSKVKKQKIRRSSKR